MEIKRRQSAVVVFFLAILLTTACSAPPRAPNLGGLYRELAQNEDPRRNAVILIPGILGSKLVDKPSDERGPQRQTSRLISPITWKQVLFLFSDHRNITNDPAFTDNLLYILLESP